MERIGNWWELVIEWSVSEFVINAESAVIINMMDVLHNWCFKSLNIQGAQLMDCGFFSFNSSFLNYLAVSSIQNQNIPQHWLMKIFYFYHVLYTFNNRLRSLKHPVSSRVSNNFSAYSQLLECFKTIRGVKRHAVQVIGV